MFKSFERLLKRISDLGPIGVIHRIHAKSSEIFGIWSQSVWWGWNANKGVSDTAFLRCIDGDWQSIETFLDHLGNRPDASFLFPHEQSQKTTQLFNNNYPEYFLAVIKAADAACRNELTLLGQKFIFPDGINWQSDPVTGWRFPLLHRSRVGKLLGSDRPVDLIIFWELNRHQHFISLGIAYWLTGKEKYLEAFSSQILSWIEANPLQHGVNWYYPLEISIRLLAWTAAFQFFRKSPEFQRKVGKPLMKSLRQQADFLSTHLQTTRTDTPNNHMIAELVGLVLVGSVFPEFRKATLWRETGLSLLTQQIDVQTYPDGVNKEQATGYHRFISELLLLIIERGHQGAIPREPVLEQTLEKMLDFIIYSMTPSGTAPQWGDSDFGRALGLGQEKDFWDFRPILSAGAALFGRTDWKNAAGRFDEEAFWILGSNGLGLWQQLEACSPEQTSRAFSSAGQYIIRDSWTSDTDVAFIRCGPFGLGGEGHCAHAHADLLSFSLWVKGKPLLVDSGTYTYHGPWRDYFRLTAAHNTVMVDDCDQATPKPNFNWVNIPEAKCLNWSDESVTGMMTYPNQVAFIRTLNHSRPGQWELKDQFSGKTKHKLEWFFHFSPGLSLQWAEDSVCISVRENGRPFVAIIPPKGVQIILKDGWVSNSYGKKEPNSVLQGVWNGIISDNKIDFHWKFIKADQ